MKLNTIGKTFSNAARYAGLAVSKHGPAILTAIGSVGVVTAAVMACKATLKKDEAVAEVKEAINESKEIFENEINDENATVGEDFIKAYRKNIFDLYVKKGVILAKLYGPSILVGIASLSCFYTSKHVMNKRYSACLAACSTTERLFSDYRKRVVEELGEEADTKYRYGVRTVEEEIPVLDKKGNPKLDKDGKPKTETKVTKHIDRDVIDYDYSALFDEISTKQWDTNYEYNLSYLRQMEQYANERLMSRGYLFLNEVKQMLGLKIDEAGQDVGWVFIKNNPIGDNRVDFGLDEVIVHNGITGRAMDFMCDENNAILLKFNCDGYIRDKILKAQMIYD